MNRYKRPGWFSESYRHSLARRGIKSANKNFHDGERFINRNFKHGLKGDISAAYVELFKPSGPIVGYAKPKSNSDIFDIQDNNQERVIHSGWSEGNSYRYVLEGTGDIFRELTLKIPHYSYINEKIRRIERHIEEVETIRTGNNRWDTRERIMLKKQYGLDPLKTNIHPEDSYEYSYLNNKEKFEKMIEQWKSQPTNTKLQMVAKDLNISMLNKDFKKAKQDINIIKSHFES